MRALLMQAVSRGKWIKAAVLLAALLILAALGGCGPNRDDFESAAAFEQAESEFAAARAERREQIKALALGRIEAFNRAGVDPLALGPVKLLALESACLAAGVISVTVEGQVDLIPGDVAPDVAAFCEVAGRAARAYAPPPAPAS